MSEISLLEAVNMALHYEMEHDPDVVVLGEDVGVNGGVFRATVGLRDKFGFKRVIDTPLAEGLIAGVAVGMATQGLKPVAEFQFQGFIFPGWSRSSVRRRGCETAPVAVSPVPLSIAPRMALAFTRRNTTARVSRRCLPIFPGCG